MMRWRVERVENWVVKMGVMKLLDMLDHAVMICGVVWIACDELSRVTLEILRIASGVILVFMGYWTICTDKQYIHSYRS
jgi:hypothetical protein